MGGRYACPPPERTETCPCRGRTPFLAGEKWGTLAARVALCARRRRRGGDPERHPWDGATAAVSKIGTTAGAAVDSSASVERSKPTGKDGIFGLCPTTFRVGDLVNVEISRRDVPPVRFQQRLT